MWTCLTRNFWRGFWMHFWGNSGTIQGNFSRRILPESFEGISGSGGVYWTPHEKVFWRKFPKDFMTEFWINPWIIFQRNTIKIWRTCSTCGLFVRPIFFTFLGKEYFLACHKINKYKVEFLVELKGTVLNSIFFSLTGAPLTLPGFSLHQSGDWQRKLSVNSCESAHWRWVIGFVTSSVIKPIIGRKSRGTHKILRKLSKGFSR